MTFPTSLMMTFSLPFRTASASLGEAAMASSHSCLRDPVSSVEVEDIAINDNSAASFEGFFEDGWVIMCFSKILPELPATQNV